MANQQVIRAWKDPAYRNSLSEAERAGLPVNPAGSIELSDADLGKAGEESWSSYMLQLLLVLLHPAP